MQIILIGKRYIDRLILSPNATGSYWLTERTNEKRLQIEAVEGTCTLKVEKEIKFFKHSYTGKEYKWIEGKEDVILEEYDCFGITFSGINEMFYLFCMPLMENYKHFSISDTKEIFIGRNEKNMIVYQNDLIIDYHAKLEYDGEKWLLENYDTKSDIFVNGKVMHRLAKTIRNGDVVFIMGLKIILMNQDIYISNRK